MKYLIWSNEHRAWWGPNSIGFTTLTHAAGRYNKDEAERICDEARKKIMLPDEVMVVAPEHQICDQQFWQAVHASTNPRAVL